jgi:AcrR family transcriptional regulator
LLDAAERLWGERGVDAVSLREIRIAAGQRNSSALQFHFGDRDGLLLALSQRHLPRLAALKEELYATVVARGDQDDLAALVEVMVRPNAEYVGRGPSERAWIRISAEQIGRPEIALQDVMDHTPAISRLVGGIVYGKLTEIVGPPLALERLMSVIVASHHLCADRARLQDAPASTLNRTLLPFDDWVDNLVAMAVAAMVAPPRRR